MPEEVKINTPNVAIPATAPMARDMHTSHAISQVTAQSAPDMPSPVDVAPALTSAPVSSAAAQPVAINTAASAPVDFSVPTPAPDPLATALADERHDEMVSAALHEEYGEHLPQAPDAPIVTQVGPTLKRSLLVPLVVAVMVLLAAGVGAMGYVGYRDNQQAAQDKADLESKVANLQQQLADAKQQIADASSATTVSGATAAGTIKLVELGVLMPLPSGLGDLAYAKIPSPTGDPSVVVVGFTTQTLLSACGTVSQCAAAQSPLGTLTKTLQSKRPVAGYGSGKLLATLGGYDYVYGSPRNLLKPANAIPLQSSQEALLQTAIPQVAPLK